MLPFHCATVFRRQRKPCPPRGPAKVGFCDSFTPRSLHPRLLFSLPFACASLSLAAHTLEASRRPRCLLRLSAHTTPVGVRSRAQPEGRNLGFCTTSHLGFSPSQLACELVTRKFQVPTDLLATRTQFSGKHSMRLLAREATC